MYRDTWIWETRTYPSNLTRMSLEVKCACFCLAVNDPVQKSESSYEWREIGRLTLARRNGPL